MCMCMCSYNEIFVLIIYNSLMVKRGIFISAMVVQFHLVESFICISCMFLRLSYKLYSVQSPLSL